MGFRFGKIDIVILDDLRATICPILRTAIEIDSLKVHMNPKQFHSSLLGLRTRVDYLSPKIGDWEPFIEKFNVSFSYRTIYKINEYPTSDKSQSKVVIQSPPRSPSKLTPRTVPQSSLPKYPHVPGQHHISAQNVYGTGGMSIGTSRGTRINANTRTPHSAPDWSQFIPDTSVSIFSLSPLWVNVTPQLCQLLIWFVPTLSGYVTAATLVTSIDSPLVEKQITIRPTTVVIPQSLEELGVGNTAIPTAEDTDVRFMIY